MLRCIILDDYQGVALNCADWSALAGEVEVSAVRDHLTGDRLVDAIEDCEIVVVMRERTPFDAALLARLPRLKLLITSGLRNGAIDLAAAAARGVTVCGTGSASHPPAELTWALILGLARSIARENRALREGGPWQSSLGFDLAGRRLGVIGLGKIGARVARIGLAFGMEVAAWSQNLTPERAAAEGVGFAASKVELLATSDIVSIHLVLSERSRGLIGAADLRHMRPDAFLINTSRAAIVDGDALAAALERRAIAGAGLDVFDIEPLPAESVWRRLDNVLATPHLGYVSQANYRTYFTEAVEDIAAYLAGAPVRVLKA